MMVLLCHLHDYDVYRSARHNLKRAKVHCSLLRIPIMQTFNNNFCSFFLPLLTIHRSLEHVSYKFILLNLHFRQSKMGESAQFTFFHSITRVSLEDAVNRRFNNKEE